MVKLLLLTIKFTVMKDVANKNRKLAQNTREEELTLSYKERQELEIEKAQREARWKMQIFIHI